MATKISTLLDVLPATTLSLNTADVSTSDGTAAVVTEVMTYQVPEGTTLAFAQQILPILDLNDDATPTEMPRATEFGLAFYPRGGGPRRSIPLGPRLQEYGRWYGLSTTEQQNKDYRDRLALRTMKIHPILVLEADDILVFQVYHATATLDISECTIELPCFIGSPGWYPKAELAWRRYETGW